jgi:hypothetical protein
MLQIDVSPRQAEIRQTNRWQQREIGWHTARAARLVSHLRFNIARTLKCDFSHHTLRTMLDCVAGASTAARVLSHTTFVTDILSHAAYIFTHSLITRVSICLPPERRRLRRHE